MSARARHRRLARHRPRLRRAPGPRGPVASSSPRAAPRRRWRPSRPRGLAGMSSSSSTSATLARMGGGRRSPDRARRRASTPPACSARSGRRATVDPAAFADALRVNVLGTFLAAARDRAGTARIPGRVRGLLGRRRDRAAPALRRLRGVEGRGACGSSRIWPPTGCGPTPSPRGSSPRACTTRRSQAGAARAGADYFERTQRDLEAGGTSPDVAAELVVLAALGRCAGISGRLLSAPWDRGARRVPAAAREPNLATLAHRRPVLREVARWHPRDPPRPRSSAARRSAFAESLDVNWSDELESLHEESSRDHFLDVWRGRRARRAAAAHPGGAAGRPRRRGAPAATCSRTCTPRIPGRDADRGRPRGRRAATGRTRTCPTRSCCSRTCATCRWPTPASTRVVSAEPARARPGRRGRAARSSSAC